ncbi:MAG: class I SAM-dependent methyltransferase [Gammaproteobacteria bacterium]
MKSGELTAKCKTRNMKDLAKRSLRRIFELGQGAGFDILPRHFYSSIPSLMELRRSRNWREPFDMYGIAGASVSEQLAFLADLCEPFLREWADLDIYRIANKENAQGGGYGVIEAEVLYAFVRRHRPRRIVQVGCGLSTSVMIRASSKANYRPDIVCIEPRPSAYLQTAQRNGQITLRRERAQETPRSVLTNLTASDLLFVDSTHTVKPGSEVNRIILDVLPRLVPDVFIHFHDVFFPYDYQRGLLSDDLFFWIESTLLHAFLVNNAHCRIQLSLSMLHYAAPDRIKALIPRYEPQGNVDGLRAAGGRHFPSATYLLTTAPFVNAEQVKR